MRSEDRVTPLELFFDLVFVLALTQCTALMADEPTWAGLAQGIAVLIASPTTECRSAASSRLATMNSTICPARTTP